MTHKYPRLQDAPDAFFKQFRPKTQQARDQLTRENEAAFKAMNEGRIKAGLKPL